MQIITESLILFGDTLKHSDISEFITLNSLCLEINLSMGSVRECITINFLWLYSSVLGKFMQLITESLILFGHTLKHADSSKFITLN